MNTIFLCFIMIVVTGGSGMAQKKVGYTLVKQDRDISVYEKWMTYPTLSGPVDSREMKCEFYYGNTIFAGLRLIRDEKRVSQWQSHISEHKVYPQRDTAVWHEYSYHDIPWPVSDQDHYMEYRAHLRSPNVIVINFKSAVNGNIAPERKGVTRIELVGSWMLEQISPMKVKVTYKVLSNPLDIPKIFVDPVVRGSMVNTMADFVGILENQKQL